MVNQTIVEGLGCYALGEKLRTRFSGVFGRAQPGPKGLKPTARNGCRRRGFGVVARPRLVGAATIATVPSVASTPSSAGLR